MRCGFLVLGFLFIFTWIGAFVVFHLRLSGLVHACLLLVALAFIAMHFLSSHRAS